MLTANHICLLENNPALIVVIRFLYLLETASARAAFVTERSLVRRRGLIITVWHSDEIYEANSWQDF